MDDVKKAVNRLSKKYGTLRIAGDEKEVKEYISTGNLAMDLILDGGIALGYAVEWSGKSGSGKSLMLQLMLADMQKKYNAVGIWFDREKAWFNERAKELNIDLKNVILVDPADIPTITDAEILMKEILDDLPKDVYKFIAIDSISSFMKSGKADKSDMGKKAQEIHNLFRAILPHVNDKTSVHFTNQRTFKIGVLFGNPETTTGGEAPKFYTTYRIKLEDRRPLIDEKRGNEIIGNWIYAHVIKTRLGPNHRQVTFPFYYKNGIPYYGGYARLLAKRGYVSPNNKAEFESFKQKTFSYKDEKRVSEFNMEEFLEKHKELVFTTYPEYNIEEEIEVVEEVTQDD